MLDHSDIKQESPYFDNDIPRGLECETDSLINPYLFCYAIVDKAKQYGLRVLTHTEVTNISKTETFTIHTSEDTFIVDNVVNAAGVWAPFIGEMQGLDIPIKPREGHIMVGARPRR